MGTQPLERESGLRKPSRIGEEIRKELEKRGLRAPKAGRSKPNGKKISPSVEVPIPVRMTEDSLEEIDIKVKPVDQIDEGETVEDDHETASKREIVTNEYDGAEHALQPIENSEESLIEAQDETPIILEELEDTAEFEESVATEDLVDTKPLDPTEKSEDVESEEILEEVANSEQLLSNELPETAELDDETVEVLRSYKNIKSSAGFDLDQADKSDVIESLLSIASHELRSPLQAISGFLELLVNRGESDIRQEEQFLSIAYRESNHLADIVADLEAASLIESGKLKIRLAPFSMDRLLQSCVQRFNQPGWEGQIFLEDARLKDLPDLHGDEIYLRQVLNNLISVMLRSLHSGHHVFIRTVIDEYDLILQVVSGEENPSEVTLPDMKAARREFHDITQEGLGIFVARHIIEAHSGVLIAQGTEFEDLTYTIQLPLKPRTESRGTVLITEDNTHAALLMEYALERDGYIPFKATNGLEALEIVANDSVDLVILDVVLPGMDGFEVCYRMRSSPETASIPVVIVSAKSSDEYRAKALRVGADAYFKKPLVLANLLSMMEKLLENGNMNAPDEELGEVDPE